MRNGARGNRRIAIDGLEQAGQSLLDAAAAARATQGGTIAEAFAVGLSAHAMVAIRRSLGPDLFKEALAMAGLAGAANLETALCHELVRVGLLPKKRGQP